jgi:hypothetical protein
LATGGLGLWFHGQLGLDILFGIRAFQDHCPCFLDEPDQLQYRLVTHARPRPPRTYSYVITLTDDLYWSKMGSKAFPTVDKAAEAGRIAIDRLTSGNLI